MFKSIIATLFVGVSANLLKEHASNKARSLLQMKSKAAAKGYGDFDDASDDESLESQFDHSARISTHMFTEMKQEENDYEPDAYPGEDTKLIDASDEATNYGRDAEEDIPEIVRDSEHTQY